MRVQNDGSRAKFAHRQQTWESRAVSGLYTSPDTTSLNLGRSSSVGSIDVLVEDDARECSFKLGGDT